MDYAHIEGDFSCTLITSSTVHPTVVPYFAASLLLSTSPRNTFYAPHTTSEQHTRQYLLCEAASISASGVPAHRYADGDAGLV